MKIKYIGGSFCKKAMKNKILLGDCLNLLENIPDHSVDLISIDPPYEINFEKNEWDEKQLDWHFISSQYLRILKPETGNLIIFQGWTNVCETLSIVREYFSLKNWIIYDRIKGRGAKKTSYPLEKIFYGS